MHDHLSVGGVQSAVTSQPIGRREARALLCVSGIWTRTITLEVTRVVLAIGVFAIGVELPKAYMARHWKSLFFLLFPSITMASIIGFLFMT